MITSAYVDDVQIHKTANLALQTIRGLAKPKPRTDTVDRARAHGSIDSTRYYQPRTLDLTGIAQAASTGELHDVLDDLQGLFALNGSDHVLRFQRQGRTFEEQLSFRVASEFDYTLATTGRKLTYAVSLYAADPRIYSAIETIDFYDPTLSDVSGVTFPLTFPLQFTGDPTADLVVTNAGNYWSPPIFTIDGPGSITSIDNDTTGERIVFDGLELVAGDFVSIAVATRTVILLGTTERPDLIDAAKTVWFELPPGETLLRLRVAAGAQSGLTGLEVAHRDARIN
jgi:hypothetical protein